MESGILDPKLQNKNNFLDREVQDGYHEQCLPHDWLVFMCVYDYKINWYR